MIIYTIFAYLQIILISNSGTQLMSESFRVATAAWDIDWYDKPRNVQMALMMITQRAQKPIVLRLLNLISLL
jgi:hypothetical protein